MTPLAIDQWGWTEENAILYLGIIMVIGGVLSGVCYACLGPLANKYDERLLLLLAGLIPMIIGRVCKLWISSRKLSTVWIWVFLPLQVCFPLEMSIFQGPGETVPSVKTSTTSPLTLMPTTAEVNDGPNASCNRELSFCYCCTNTKTFLLSYFSYTRISSTFWPTDLYSLVTNFFSHLFFLLMQYSFKDYRRSEKQDLFLIGLQRL